MLDKSTADFFAMFLVELIYVYIKGSFLNIDVCRYGSESFSGVSQMTVMSYKELKEQLGWDQDISCILFTPPVSAKKKKEATKHKKRLSFLSDSQYLSSPPSDLIMSDNEVDEADVYSGSESHSRSSSRLADSSSLSSSLSDSHSDTDPDLAFLVSPQDGRNCLYSSLSSPSHCSSQSLTINPNGSGFPQPLFSNAEDEDEDEDGLPLPSSGPPLVGTAASNGVSSLYELTTVGDRMVENGISCSNVDLSTTSGSKVSTLLDNDSRSAMDTLPSPPPGFSDSQTDASAELATFVSSLQLPTPSFSGVLKRDAENTPFEFDPTVNHTLAVKQNLHLGSCDQQQHYRHRHHHHRAPLQPVENVLGQPLVDARCSKDDRLLAIAQGSGRARSSVANKSDNRPDIIESKARDRPRPKTEESSNY